MFHQFEGDVRHRQAELRAEVARHMLVARARGYRHPVLRRRVAEWLHAVADRLEVRDAVQAG